MHCNPRRLKRFIYWKQNVNIVRLNKKISSFQNLCSDDSPLLDEVEKEKFVKQF